MPYHNDTKNLADKVVHRYRLSNLPNDFYFNEEITAVNRLFGLKDLLDYYRVTRGWKIVEVGSYAGASAELMAQYAGVVVCCDIWEEYINPNMAPIVYKEFLDTKSRNKNIIEHKVKSEVLAKEFGKETIDMVYIDADHSYASVKADILAWSDKVKVGGLIAGHDYCMEDVSRAVDEIFKKENIRYFKDSSWAFVKQ
jgi:predicted O-methyltransferase YrrM